MLNCRNDTCFPWILIIAAQSDIIVLLLLPEQTYLCSKWTLVLKTNLNLVKLFRQLIAKLLR